MEPSESIARMGFRKWYERHLIDGHVALVTCILCMILVAACIEGLTFTAPFLTVAAMVAALLISGYGAFCSILRYQRMMTEAWRYGECATCKKCSTYGRLKVLESGAVSVAARNARALPTTEAWMNVACKKCGNTWRMPD